MERDIFKELEDNRIKYYLLLEEAECMSLVEKSKQILNKINDLPPQVIGFSFILGTTGGGTNITNEKLILKDDSDFNYDSFTDHIEDFLWLGISTRSLEMCLDMVGEKLNDMKDILLAFFGRGQVDVYNDGSIIIF